MIYFCIVFLIGHFWLVILKMETIEKKQIEREEVLKKWLFDSLYSISHNVKLPDEKIEIKPKKSKVYDPNKDPMREFVGDLDDWH